MSITVLRARRRPKGTTGGMVPAEDSLSDVFVALDDLLTNEDLTSFNVWKDKMEQYIDYAMAFERKARAYRDSGEITATEYLELISQLKAIDNNLLQIQTASRERRFAAVKQIWVELLTGRDMVGVTLLLWRKNV